ncbi:MAG: hypothetical protein WCQ41_01800 [Bacillota bacterium]
MRAKKVTVIILTLTMVFGIFAGLSQISKADSLIGEEKFIAKDLTFDSLTTGKPIPVDSPVPAFWGFGSAFTSGAVESGGADGTSNFFNIPTAWQVLGIQEREGYLEAGKSYRISLWLKGLKPYQCALNIANTPGTVVKFDLKPRIPTLTDEWQQVKLDFKAPVGAGPTVSDPNGHFYLMIQTDNGALQIDNISLKEVTIEPTPTPDPNATPTPTPRPTATPATYAGTPTIYVPTDKSDVVGGTVSTNGIITVKIGAKTYFVEANYGKWQVIFTDPLIAGTEISAINKSGSKTSDMYSVNVLPYTPAVSYLKAGSLEIKGYATANSVVYIKVGAKSYTAKTSIKSTFSVKVPKLIKGIGVSVRSKIAGFYSAYRTLKVN